MFSGTEVSAFLAFIVRSGVCQPQLFDDSPVQQKPLQAVCRLSDQGRLPVCAYHNTAFNVADQQGDYLLSVIRISQINRTVQPGFEHGKNLFDKLVRQL